MAEGVEFEGKVRDVALSLTDSALAMAGKLKKCIGGAQYERAGELAAQIRRAMRDVKWLMERLPKVDD